MFDLHTLRIALRAVGGLIFVHGDEIAVNRLLVRIVRKVLKVLLVVVGVEVLLLAVRVVLVSIERGEDHLATDDAGSFDGGLPFLLDGVFDEVLDLLTQLQLVQVYQVDEHLLDVCLVCLLLDDLTEFYAVHFGSNFTLQLLEHFLRTVVHLCMKTFSLQI